MKKNQFTQKLNNQRGVTLADIAIALLIILTSVGVISMVYTNLVIGSKDVDRKAKATQIATNIIEHFEGAFYDNIENELNTSEYITKSGNEYIITDNAFEINIPSAYSVKVILENSTEDTNNINIAKKVLVSVSYNTNGQEEKVELSKVFQKEALRECNSPKFDLEYLSAVGINNEEYMFADESSSGSGGNKIICPIKYNSELGKYQIVDKSIVENNGVWYSYSNKQWARILVLDSSVFSNENNISQETFAIENKDLLTDENSYVWIPRFGVEENGDLLGNTYFKYKNTNIAIMNSYNDSENNNFINYYLNLDLNNNIEWSTNNSISFDSSNNKRVGEWVKYSDIETINTDAYKLNVSQYGPLLEY